MCMYGCKKCSTVSGVLLLVLGLVFLLGDLGVWNWGVSWYSALFILLGVVAIAKNSCSACQEMCAASKKK